MDKIIFKKKTNKSQYIGFLQVFKKKLRSYRQTQIKRIRLSFHYIYIKIFVILTLNLHSD